jgi:hypothetical protein
MEQTKNFLTSKTVWGVIIMILGIFGIDNLPADLVDTDIIPTVEKIFGVVGGVLAIIGRVKAEKPLNAIPNPVKTAVANLKK